MYNTTTNYVINNNYYRCIVGCVVVVVPCSITTVVYRPEKNPNGRNFSQQLHYLTHFFKYGNDEIEFVVDSIIISIYLVERKLCTRCRGSCTQKAASDAASDAHDAGEDEEHGEDEDGYDEEHMDEELDKEEEIRLHKEEFDVMDTNP